MAEFYDFDTKKPVPPVKLTKAQQSRNAWNDVREELLRETEIPNISYSYSDTKNEYVIRLRGQKEKWGRTDFGAMVLVEKGKWPRFAKDFIFKAEGKTGNPDRGEIEKWQGQIMKWFKSIDGQNELKASEVEHDNGQAQAKGV